MISDQISLGSKRAYLRTEAGATNLGGTTPSSAKTPPLNPYQIWRISGMELLLEGNNLASLVRPPEPLDTPLFEVSIQKEVFPALFTNPYQTRVHNVAGMEDFAAGTLVNCFPTFVNDIPTLVSREEKTCQWTSTVYKLPLAVELFAASWELASSRLVHEQQFSYSIRLRAWSDHQTSGPEDLLIELAQGTDADDARWYPFNANQQAFKMKAFQLEFEAEVTVDGAFYESHQLEFSNPKEAANRLGEGIGTPLLRSIRLLERVESSYAYYSLAELIQAASFFEQIGGSESNFQRLLLQLDLTALLVGREDATADPYEYLELTVHNNQFSNFQVRLSIDESLASPTQPE